MNFFHSLSTVRGFDHKLASIVLIPKLLIHLPCKNPQRTRDRVHRVMLIFILPTHLSTTWIHARWWARMRANRAPPLTWLFDFSGARQNAARRRRKVYSVNKSHYCPRCNRGFTLKKNMTRHLRHECGMAPKYQCPYCDKPSKFTQNIYAHIRKYHPGQALCFKRLYWITQNLESSRARTGSSCHHFAFLRSLPFHFAPSVNAQEITESDIRFCEGKLNKMPASRVTVECPFTHPISTTE